MKLVQLLAKELKEWPESATVIVQDENKNVWSLDKELDLSYSVNEWASEEWFNLVLVDGLEILINCLASDNKTSKVTQEQWQAEREKMNNPKWIRHRGGKCPVADDVKVLYRMRSGTITSRGEPSSILSWDHSKNGGDIMAYRVIEETKDQEIEEVKVADVKLEMLQGDSLVTIGSVSSDFGASVFDGGQPAKGEEVKKTNFGTITYKLEIDATEATKEIDSLVAKWGQIESPLKWRDEIIELEAYEEEFRREREKLILKLESEGFKLIDHAPAKCLLDEWEAMDYESFCVGDTVVCIHEKPDDTIAVLTIGKEYRLILDDEQICVIDDIGDPMRYCIEIGCFKLVKRA